MVSKQKVRKFTETNRKFENLPKQCPGNEVVKMGQGGGGQGTCAQDKELRSNEKTCLRRARERGHRTLTVVVHQRHLGGDFDATRCNRNLKNSNKRFILSIEWIDFQSEWSKSPEESTEKMNFKEYSATLTQRL